MVKKINLLFALILFIQLAILCFTIYVLVITVEYVEDTQKLCSSKIDPVRSHIIRNHSYGTIGLMSFMIVIVLLTLINIFIAVGCYFIYHRPNHH